jgi:hypothetical protein
MFSCSTLASINVNFNHDIVGCLTPDEFDEMRKEAHGYELNQGSRMGLTAMHAAVACGNVELIAHIFHLSDEGENLLNLGCNSPHYRAYHGMTSLHYLIHHSQDNVIFSRVAKKIIELEANINLCVSEHPIDGGLLTPLWQAACLDKTHIIKFLFLSGALFTRKRDILRLTRRQVEKTHLIETRINDVKNECFNGVQKMLHLAQLQNEETAKINVSQEEEVVPSPLYILPNEIFKYIREVHIQLLRHEI